MQYIFLKNILETVLANYVCHNCHNKTNEQSLHVAGISSSGVDLHIHCHICGQHVQLNAEVNTLAAQMLESENGRKYFEEFLSKGGAIGATLANKTTKASAWDNNTINDDDITKIHNDLQNAKSVEDLMN